MALIHLEAQILGANSNIVIKTSLSKQSFFKKVE